MKSITVAGVVTAILVATSGTASAADKVALLDLQVNSELRKSLRYPVVLPIRIEGNAHIMNACFRWSGEGPYCFKVQHDRGKSQLRTLLITRNPNTYLLEGYVQYSVNGKIHKTNRKSKKINVR